MHDADDGAAADRLEIEGLVVPLVVVDIAAKAQDRDALLTPGDLLACITPAASALQHFARRTVLALV